MIFIDDVYSQEYYNIIFTAQARAKSKKQAEQLFPGKKFERHHIVPECFFLERKRKGPKGWIEGIANHKDNIVLLLCKEHYRCHWLLTKMTLVDENYRKRAHYLMSSAFGRMNFGQSNQEKYEVTEELYVKAKEELSIATSGVPKGPFGPRSLAAIAKTNQTKIKNGTTGKGVKKSPEAIEKYKESRKRNGKARSEEAKRQAVETARKNGTTRKGIPMSAEAKAKLSAAKKGVKRGPHSAETRAKISAGQKGNKRGPETGEKIRQILLGKKRSPESIAKQHETLRKKQIEKTSHSVAD